MARNDVRLGWIPDHKDVRDMVFGDVVPPQSLPSRVDLTETWNVPVVNQGNLGSCTANAISTAMSYLQAKEGVNPTFSSRLFIYYNEREMEGTIAEDSGAEIRDGIKSVVSLGAPPETDWPYEISRYADRPSDLAYTNASKHLVKTYQRVLIRSYSIMGAIALGFPVIFGISVYDSFMNSTDGVIPMPGLQEAVAGGHAMIAVGYDQEANKFKFQNSWGTDWGQRGFGYIPFDYLGNTIYGGDYWIVTSDEYSPPPAPVPVPEPVPDPVVVPEKKGCNPLGFLKRS